MSGIEVIGVIASASQLVRYVLDIIDYTKTVSVLIKCSSYPFQQHKQHLENLVSAVETIRQTPILQTSLIETHLQTLSRTAASLCDTLKPFSRVSQQTALGKIWTAIQAHKAEGQILKDLNILERDKSNLLLCITSSYGPILHGIQERSNSNLVIVKDTMPQKAAKAAMDVDHSDQKKSSDFVPVNDSTPHHNSGYGGYKAPERSEASRLAQRPERRPEPKVYNGERRRTADGHGSASTQSIATSTDYSHVSGDIFSGNNSTNAASVVNGTATGGELSDRRNLYKGNCSDGKDSVTLNGCVDKVSGTDVLNRKS